jgi:nitroreductase
MRTAPSAMNWQETDIYVIMSSGAYVYDAAGNSLKPVASGDLRALTGVQPYVKNAPVSLVYVADAKKMTMSEDIPKPMKDVVEALKEPMKWADSAVIAENVYIFAASEGLATGVRALIDRAALAKALRLGSDQSIMLAQCVGLPKR